MTDDKWRAEWVDMPEFIQEKSEPYQKINIRFRNIDDVEKFAELIGQNITPRTKSLWFPKLERGINRYMQYEDSIEVSNIYNI